MSKGRVLVAVLLAAIVGVTAWATWPPAGPRSARVFDADRVAALEVEMWRAYYGKEKVRLFRLLVVTLREQYRYSWARAAQAAFHLARAAATFGDARGDYGRVLPDLTAGFDVAREWTRAGFDPRAVARAELAWWVARRDPAARDPENVGRLIGQAYALLYEVPLPRVREAGVLRARAGALRDAGGASVDWVTVGELLRSSYRALRAGVAGGADPSTQPPPSAW